MCVLMAGRPLCSQQALAEPVWLLVKWCCTRRALAHESNWQVCPCAVSARGPFYCGGLQWRVLVLLVMLRLLCCVKVVLMWPQAPSSLPQRNHKVAGQTPPKMCLCWAARGAENATGRPAPPCCRSGAIQAVGAGHNSTFAPTHKGRAYAPSYTAPFWRSCT